MRLAELTQGEAARKKAGADAKAAEAERQRLTMLKAEDDRKRAEANLPRPGREFRDCANVCPVRVVLPKGEFMMGSPANEKGREDNEGPQHKVTIAWPFAVGKYEVTFAEWEACVADSGCRGNRRPIDHDWGKGRRPVVNVSWNDGKEYVRWLSGKTGQKYRLLSEAEWEYAARAGTTTKFAFGDTISKRQAQYSEGGSLGSAGKTEEVGKFPANAWGLHDMHGNVWELVEDAWRDNYEGAPQDGSVWAGGDASFRVARGGSWYGSYPDYLRSAIAAGTGPATATAALVFELPEHSNPCLFTSLPLECRGKIAARLQGGRRRPGLFWGILWSLAADRRRLWFICAWL